MGPMARFVRHDTFIDLCHSEVGVLAIVRNSLLH